MPLAGDNAPRLSSSGNLLSSLSSHRVIHATPTPDSPRALCGVYLGVKFSSVVQKSHADPMQAPDFTRVVLEALKHATAHIASADQAVLDFR